MPERIYLTLLPRADYQASCVKLGDDDLLAGLRAVGYIAPRLAAGRVPTQPWALLWAGYTGALGTLGAYYAAEFWHRHQKSAKAARLYKEAEDRRRELQRPRRGIALPDWFGVKELHDSHLKFLETRDYGDLYWPTEDEEEF
jgi:hypothetical protein